MMLSPRPSRRREFFQRRRDVDGRDVEPIVAVVEIVHTRLRIEKRLRQSVGNVVSLRGRHFNFRDNARTRSCCGEIGGRGGSTVHQVVELVEGAVQDGRSAARGRKLDGGLW